MNTIIICSTIILIILIFCLFTYLNNKQNLDHNQLTNDMADYIEEFIKNIDKINLDNIYGVENTTVINNLKDLVEDIKNIE